MTKENKGIIYNKTVVQEGIFGIKKCKKKNQTNH